jgi:hypothetical protein
MWILNILPEISIHIIFFIGLLGVLFSFVVGMLPVVKNYRLPIQIGFTFIFVLGVYLECSLASEKEWKLKISEVKEQLALAQAKSSEKNVIIQEKVVTQTRVLKEKGNDIIKYIDRIVEVHGPEKEKYIEITKYIETCPIPTELIKIHNDATLINK